jgi:hypothetical protein
MASATAADTAAEPAKPRKALRDRLPSALCLAALVACFAAYSALAVPRLTNNAIGDLEFTGWSGPIAEHLLRGERPYVDFVLPIPPGSFSVLALIQKLGGRPLLLQELWLNAACALGMALLAVVITRPFGSRQNAWLAAFATLVVLIGAPKECAYDTTAELFAWASVAAGVQAFVADAPGRRRGLFGAAGLAAALTLVFKQSTGAGVLAGWLGAASYLVLVHLFRRDRTGLRARVPDALSFALGGVLGFVSLVVLLAAEGSSLGAFYQAVFRDSAALKGGSIALSVNLLSYLIGSPAFPASLVFTLMAAVVLLRLTRRPGALAMLPHDTDARFGARHAAPAVALALFAFGGATLAIALGARAVPDSIGYFTERLRYVPTFGLLFLCVAFAALIVPSALRSGPPRAHELAAVTLVALVTSLLHNLSSPEFRPFYDPNPIIPLAFAYLFTGLDRAELPKTKLLVYALALAALYSPKFGRVLAADLPTGRMGRWSGLYVNASAVPIVHAAQRVWELTDESDEVLVLPEDLEIAALVGRRRPPLTGAVVFVDQYPKRVAKQDLAKLERRLPKIVLLRPANRAVWVRLFSLWSSNSGAREILDRFLDDFLPHHYRLDSSYPTRYGDSTIQLQIWVLDH